VSFPFAVADVVAMGRAPWAGTAAAYADEVRIRDALTVTETAEFADRPFNALSGGEQARVMLARVIAQDGSVVMLDEPTAALDLRHQEPVGRLCRGLAAEGHAVIIVVHDLDLAAYSDRVALLSAGRVDARGDPSDVLTAERVGAVYRQPVRIETDAATGAPRVVPVR
jgi:iron complex transport system ATP-binding protein